MTKGRKQFKVIKQVPEGIDEREMMHIFQQLAGDPSKLDPEIVQDKYNRLHESLSRCNKLMRKFKVAILDRLVTKIGHDVYFDQEVANLVRFLDNAEAYLDEKITPENMIPIYQAMKESFVVEEYLKVCKALRQGDSCLKDRTNLQDSFIRKAIGDELVLFDFCKINFKHLFSHILEENLSSREEVAGSKTYILLTLNMLYITTQDIYNLVSSPDVDIDKLSEIIIQAIKAARKQIPRCDKAFRMIEESVDMLKSGMNGYYKNFVATGNPTVIFENFINDLSGDLHIDTKTMGQFKRIIFFFRKKSEGMPKQNSEQLNGVFSMLDKIMSQIDKDDMKKPAATSNSDDDADIETVHADE
jgi:uncharacterized protein YfbU (UPF0304 family)